jgi:hypothetical protein
MFKIKRNKNRKFNLKKQLLREDNLPVERFSLQDTLCLRERRDLRSVLFPTPSWPTNKSFFSVQWAALVPMDFMYSRNTGHGDLNLSGTVLIGLPSSICE